MYCSKCGKYIGTGDKLCQDCILKEKQYYQAQPRLVRVQPDRERGKALKGLGVALASTVLGLVFSVIFCLFALYGPILIMFADEGDLLPLVLVIAAWLITFGGVILSAYLGAKSIMIFKEEKRAGRKKPIATLVLGLIGLSFVAASAVAITYLFILFVTVFLPLLIPIA